MQVRSRGSSSPRHVMSSSRWGLPPVLVALCAGATFGLEPTEGQRDEAEVRALVVEAVERMNEELGTAAERYRVLMTSEDREFDADGAITEETTVEWERVPVDGAGFRRRLAIDGRPLTEEQRAREVEREAAFRERLRRLRAGETEPQRNENALEFNEELVSRYDLTLDGEEVLRGRPSYRIAFAPRDGDLPVRRPMDRALNKARGRIWIDREAREVARIEFELIERVRLWWGLVGTIHHFRGSMDRGPVLDGIWASLQDENYRDIRFFFSRSRQASMRRWRAYEWTDTEAAQDESAAGNPDVADGDAR